MHQVCHVGTHLSSQERLSALAGSFSVGLFTARSAATDSSRVRFSRCVCTFACSTLPRRADKNTYFHNVKWSEASADNEAKQYGAGSPRGFHRGRDYMEEDRRMWEETTGVTYPPEALAVEAD